MSKDTVCILSGGLDSTTLAAQALHEGRLHTCLSFDYGQKHSKELDYATANCRNWGVDHFVVSLQGLANVCFLGSALTGTGDMPEGHYADDNMKQTVVPNRNMLMLSAAIAFAVSTKLHRVLYGAHSGDHTIYPDCRPEFVALMDHAARIANWHPVVVEAPFLDLDKHGILQIGYELGVDYGLTWTCYQGGERPCGKCGSCQERLEAFAKLGKLDPLVYA